MSDLIRAEVVYALPMKQTMLVVKLVAGSTVRDAIQASGLLQRVPELVLDTLKVGIYSRLVSLDTLLRGGERIEVYRPLTADPRAMRKQRAEKAKERGG